MSGRRRALVLMGLAMILAAALQAAAAETQTEERKEGTVALKLALPRAMFVGTPRDIRAPNLEPPRKAGEPRPPFYVPAGVSNVARGKAVTASDMFPVIGELELVTDGSKEGEDGSYVELGPGRQWAQIDLGETFEIHAIVVWHFHSQARVYRDVVVQLGQDEDLIEDVTTVYNNDHDNSAGSGIGRDKEYVETYEGRIMDAEATAARYVRLYSNGSTSGEMNHYVEVEVYGKKAD